MTTPYCSLLDHRRPLRRPPVWARPYSLQFSAGLSGLLATAWRAEVDGEMFSACAHPDASPFLTFLTEDSQSQQISGILRHGRDTDASEALRHGCFSHCSEFCCQRLAGCFRWSSSHCLHWCSYAPPTGFHCAASMLHLGFRTKVSG